MRFFLVLSLLALTGCSVIPQDAINELRRLNDNLEAYKRDVRKVADAAQKIEEHIKWVRKELMKDRDE